MFGDFGEVVFNVSAANMYGVLSLAALNCTDGGGKNRVKGGDDDGELTN